MRFLLIQFCTFTSDRNLSKGGKRAVLSRTEDVRSVRNATEYGERIAMTLILLQMKPEYYIENIILKMLNQQGKGNKESDHTASADSRIV